MTSRETAAVAERLLDAFSVADLEAMRALLAEDLVAYVTNAEGGMDRVEVREGYLGRVAAIDLPSARLSVELTQPPVAVDAEQVLLMVEIRAHAATGRCTTSPPICSASRAAGSPSGGWSTRSRPRATRSGARCG